MAVKDVVLDFLIRNEGKHVSGQMISEEIGCSRMAVSKSVQSLIADGYDIRASKKLGYIYQSGDVLSEKTLAIAFGELPVYYYPETTSTFAEARKLLASGVKSPFCTVAAMQTGGRGRLGRSFFSPKGGLYLCLTMAGSSITCPDMVTISAAVAVSESIEALSGRKTAIKWVNDIYLDGRKIVGILTEGIVNMELGGLDEVIVGIGVNLSGTEDEIPEDLRGKMGFIYQDSPPAVSRAALAADISKRLLDIQSTDFISLYRERCFVIGREVTVIKAGKMIQAYAYGLDDAGHLLVRYTDGREEVLSSGEVSLRI